MTALDPIRIDDHTLIATARREDDTRSELRATVRGASLRIGSKGFKRTAIERPAPADVAQALVAAYRTLEQAVDAKDFDAFQATRTDDFATIPPDSPPRNARFMATRARGLLAGIQPPVHTHNDFLTLTLRGDEAIATVRQHFARRQPNREGVVRRVETSVTQRETWRRTPQGWKLVFVDEVHDNVRWAEDEK
ncbi:MAG TPA: nuclear transport factor 2 family protein [Thermoanaerobaculia bacterium]|nr:nuclear transport factor 2 family protein [Thermoanaerobaculia bacterium]